MSALLILLLLILIIVFSPIPLLSSHVRWCLNSGLIGDVTLILSAMGLVEVVIGLVLKHKVASHLGFILFVAPVLGVAIFRVVTTDYWREVSLVGAFLLSMILIYLPVCYGRGLFDEFIDKLDRPMCREGRCKPSDYELRKIGNEYIWVCRCGIRYRRIGRRFFVLREDGSLAPYMKRKLFSGWLDDK
jgi:hypothetical protein